MDQFRVFKTNRDSKDSSFLFVLCSLVYIFSIFKNGGLHQATQSQNQKFLVKVRKYLTPFCVHTS